jgi:hypothetical protein
MFTIRTRQNSKALTVSIIMKLLSSLAVAAAAAGIIFLAGCASTSKHETSLTKEEILRQPDVKGKEPTVFPKGLEEVRQAGSRALTFVGCEVKTQDPLFLSGRRPNKFGFFVGSGGETVKIFLYPQSESETHVWVDTDLSFVGMAGQQGWNKQVLGEMTKILNSTPTAKAQ